MSAEDSYEGGSNEDVQVNEHIVMSVRVKPKTKKISIAPPRPDDVVVESDLEMKAKLIEYDVHTAMFAEFNRSDLGRAMGIPVDDVEVVSEKRRTRLAMKRHPSIKESQNTRIPPFEFVKCAVENCTKDWVSVKENFEKFRSNRYIAKSTPSANLEQLVYEVDIDLVEETPSGTRPIDEDILQEGRNLFKEGRLLNSIQEMHNDLFPLFPILEPLDIREPFSNISLPKRTLGASVLVDCHELNFEFGNYEPFLCELSLYDIEKEKKLSETFSFSCSSERTLELASFLKSGKTSLNMTRKCIFRLLTDFPSTHLVLTVFKVVKGEGSDNYVQKYYMNPDKVKEKDITKFKSSNKERFTKYGDYLEPFAIDSTPIFTEEGEIINGEHVLENLRNVTKFEKNLCVTLKNMDKKKGGKNIPGFFKFDLTSITSKDKIPGIYTEDLLPVKPKTDSDDVIKEMSDLQCEDLIIEPAMHYVSNLFFYPRTCNMTRSTIANARNIILEIKVVDEDNTELDGLPIIFGSFGSPDLVTSKRTSIQYHNKKPVFTDEVKIQLPLAITQKLHIFIKFYHVQIGKKGKTAEPEKLLGQAFIPLFQNNQIIQNGEHESQVAIDLPPLNYLDEEVLAEAKMMDSGKLVFSYGIQCISTIYPQDRALASGLIEIEKLIAMEEDGFVKQCENAIADMTNANLNVLVRHFPVVLNTLFTGLCSEMPHQVKKRIFVTLIWAINSVFELTQDSKATESYLEHALEVDFNAPYKLHEILIRYWIFDDGAAKASWFLFRAVRKSIALYLKHENKLVSPDRTGEIPVYIPDLVKLIKNILLLARGTILLEKAKAPLIIFLNRQLAYFIRDLFSLVNIGSLFYLIEIYLTDLVPKNDEETLVLMKFTFLKIIFEYQHFLALCIPTKQKYTQNISNLNGQHFLPNLFIQEIEHCMSSTNPKIRSTGICVLRDILWKLSMDFRNSDGEVKEILAQIFFPILPAILDNFHSLWPVESFNTLPVGESRAWLVCGLFVLRYGDNSFLRNWMKSDTEKRQLRLLDFFWKSLEIFGYQGVDGIRSRSEDIFEPRISFEVQAVGEMEISESEDDMNMSKKKRKKMKKRESKTDINTSRITSSSNMWSIERFHSSKQSKQNLVLSIPVIISKESALAQEVSITLLELLIMYTKDHKATLLKKSNCEPNGLTDKIISIIIKYLNNNQTVPVLSIVLDYLRFIFTEYSRPLFEYRNSFCGDLVHSLLVLCNSNLLEVRSKACSLTYLMFENNYKAMKNISRMKLQSAKAISAMFGPHLPTPTQDDFIFLKECLKAISFSSKGNRSLDKNFGADTSALTMRLEKLIDSNIEMEEYSFDPSTKADLYVKISNHYIDSPDLRITQLNKLAELHKLEGQEETAANVFVFSACLISCYLRLIGRCPEYLPVPEDYLRVFPSIMDILLLPKASELESLKDEICNGREFTEAGYIDMLKTAILLFQKSQMNEACVEVYNLLLPIYQHKRDYISQSQCYNEMHKLCEIVTTDQSRLFSIYYRVLIHMPEGLLPELDGSEFVFKMPGHVRLKEFTDSITGKFASKLGDDKVHVVSNLKNMKSADDVEDGHLYLQIVTVNQHVNNMQHSTEYERHFNIDKFTYESPFTQEGKAQTEDYTKQWLRKHILHLNGAFPHILTRLPVVEKTNIELTPLEYATEITRSKSEAVERELGYNAEAKSLQLLLNGVLLAQVNAGPLPVARTFLGEEEKYPVEHIIELKETFVKFVRILADAVAFNKGEIHSSQLLMQNQIELGYFKFKREVEDLTGTDLSAIVETFEEPRDMLDEPEVQD